MIDAIVHRYGYKEGLTIKGDTITKWPYSEPFPSASELDSIIEDYEIVTKRSAIKAKAMEVILNRIPEYKQRNLLAEACVILADTTLSQEELDIKLHDYKSYLSWVKSVREYSDELEGMVAVGSPVDINEGWPEWPPEPLLSGLAL